MAAHNYLLKSIPRSSACDLYTTPCRRPPATRIDVLTRDPETLGRRPERHSHAIGGFALPRAHPVQSHLSPISQGKQEVL